MADKSTSEMKPTLGLTGLTMNAMALIAPGAFLWLTFAIQGAEGASAPSMWRWPAPMARHCRAPTMP